MKAASIPKNFTPHALILDYTKLVIIGSNFDPDAPNSVEVAHCVYFITAQFMKTA